MFGDSSSGLDELFGDSSSGLDELFGDSSSGLDELFKWHVRDDGVEASDDTFVQKAAASLGRALLKDGVKTAFGPRTHALGGLCQSSMVMAALAGRFNPFELV